MGDTAYVNSAIFTAFSAEAMICGAKTQTRRLAWTDDRLGGQRDERPMRTAWQRRCRGDLIWVREPYAIIDGHFIPQADFPSGIPEGMRPVALEAVLKVGEAGLKWMTPLYLPRARSRLTLVVLNTWLEFLHNISEGDARREGVRRMLPESHKGFRGHPPARFGWARGQRYEDGLPTARAAFERLWVSIHGQKLWDANPQVVVISFDAIEQNVDAYMAHYKLTQRNPRRDANAQRDAA
jgi:hypothetical protein